MDGRPCGRIYRTRPVGWRGAPINPSAKSRWGPSGPPARQGLAPIGRATRCIAAIWRRLAVHRTCGVLDNLVACFQPASHGGSYCCWTYVEHQLPAQTATRRQSMHGLSRRLAQKTRIAHCCVQSAIQHTPVLPTGQPHGRSSQNQIRIDDQQIYGRPGSHDSCVPSYTRGCQRPS